MRFPNPAGLTLTDPRLFTETPRGRLWHARLAGHEVAVKVPRDDWGDEARAALACRAWAEHGAVRVFHADDTVLIMEWLDGPVLGDLARNGDLQGADRTLLDVAARLHRAPPAGIPGSPGLTEWCQPLLAHPAPSGDMLTARAICRRLIGSAGRQEPLHGDLHHDNVLLGPAGWRFIDPKVIHGDPGFELGNVFRNPAGCEANWPDPDRIDRLATMGARALGLERRRVLGWAAVQAALSAAWFQQDGQSPDRDLELLPVLLAAFDAS